MRISDWSSDVCSSDLSDTNEAVSSMEQTTSEVVAGARLAEDAGTALGEIESVSTSLPDLIEGISSASQPPSEAATTRGRRTCEQSVGQYVESWVVIG